MPSFIALHGPPGCGKSTIIKQARKQGQLAYDIEELGDSYAARLAAAREVFAKHRGERVLFGAADLSPKDFPDGTKQVLILPPKDIYCSRVNCRDTDIPHKAGQGGVEYKYDAFAKRREDYDGVIEAAGGVLEAFAEIRSKFDSKK